MKIIDDIRSIRRSDVRCLATIFWRAFVSYSKDYSSIISHTIFMLMLLMVFDGLWRAVGGGISKNHADSVWYLFFNEMIAFSSIILARQMRFDNSQGLLIGQLIRPLPVSLVYGIEAFGQSLGRSLFIIILCAPFLYFYSGALPSSISGLFLSLLFLPGALLIDKTFVTAIGTLNLWMGDAQPLEWVYQKMSFLLGGMLLPMAFYPDLLVLLAKCTPFYWMMSGFSRFVYGVSATEVISTLIFVALWIVIGSLTSYLSYRVAIRKINYSGGVG